MSVYNKIIKTLQQVPDSAAYKSYTLATVNDRLKIVQNVRITVDNSIINTLNCATTQCSHLVCHLVQEADPSQVEQKIGCGQCEELLVQAENELSLARRFVVDKPWEPLISKPPANQWKWPI